MESRARNVVDRVKAFHEQVVKETRAFYELMKEYGELRSEGQRSYTVQSETFRIEVKSCKVKCFDERADIAASRLIDFLKEWIEGRERGADDPMYQLAMMLIERNRNGDLDYKSISKLYDLEIKFNSPEYSSIMQLFKESNIVEEPLLTSISTRRLSSASGGNWSRHSIACYHLILKTMCDCIKKNRTTAQ